MCVRPPLIRDNSSSESSLTLTGFAGTLASCQPSNQRDIQGRSMLEQYSRTSSVLLSINADRRRRNVTPL